MSCRFNFLVITNFNIHTLCLLISEDPVDEASVVLRRRRTIESTQAQSTRAPHCGGKQFHYNKLVNDRTAARNARQGLAKSMGQGMFALHALNTING